MITARIRHCESADRLAAERAECAHRRFTVAVGTITTKPASTTKTSTEISIQVPTTLATATENALGGDSRSCSKSLSLTWVRSARLTARRQHVPDLPCHQQ